jgi:hypothetical protein
MLAHRTGSIDIVVGGLDWQSGAVALVDATHAVLCLQRFNDVEGDLVEAYRVATDSLAAELVRLVPEWPGGHSIPIRLPLRAVRAAQAVLTDAYSEDDEQVEQDSDPEVVEQRLRATLREHGVDAGAAGKLVSVLHPLECYGQMGVTRPGPDGEDVRVGAELSWIDTPRGRYSISSTSDGDGWVSINPLHPDELLGMARGFVSAARR